MIKQGFYIGNRDWWVMVYYDVQPHNLTEIEGVLLSNGCTREQAEETCRNIRQVNTGFTMTDYNNRNSVILVSHTTSAEQMFDTIMHEIKHLTEHISNYYNLDPKEELAAYLQGEVGRQMWCAASMVLCPHCNCER